ncbi:MAG: dipeptide/oligopeptide/nickel ABC transporter ATP-binding protein [Candidatus Aminicenantes bacterium]|nr:dipeptide/oligopeptide/nickel ABC transporter ATP-binding protein [Candidatus Aminicenantes bacterium]
MEARFRLDNVSKTYQRQRWGKSTVGHKALDGVNLDLGERQACVLTGRSGAGKSTLARMIVGRERPDSGRVLFQGRPLALSSRADFNRRNQLMSQNPFLAVNPCFTIREIVSEPLRIAAVEPETVSEKLCALFSLLELPELFLERRPHELSGGELQRVVLARALALEPDFLVLDEPFSALDDLTAWRILLQFKKIFQRLRLGILFISHHPRHIRLLADRVLVLENGRLLES